MIPEDKVSQGRKVNQFEIEDWADIDGDISGPMSIDSKTIKPFDVEEW